jgi:hypothetical protein
VSGADPRAAGLCATCRHARLVTTPRSRFLLCERSRGDASYERYPRLPVLACRGHEPLEDGPGAAGGGAPPAPREPAE